MSTHYLETIDIRRNPLRSWDDNLRLIDEIYSEFQNLDIATLGASRIRAYRDAFLALMTAAKHKSHRQQAVAENVLQTLVEFQRLRVIIEATRTSVQREAWQERLRQLVSGSAFPRQEESDSSAARDFQFESYVAAVCELSGYGISFSEPDVIVRDQDCCFGIAAKRPRSSRTIDRNCRKATAQIKRSKLPGMVALDLSTALYPNQCINTNDLDGVILFVETAANHFIACHYDRLKYLCRDDSVFAVLVSLQLPALNLGNLLGPQVVTGTRWVLAPMCEPQDARRGWIFDFTLKAELGLFGPRLPNEREGDV
jgi:hypothetical protein